jgi:hypothetical protein
MQNQFFDQTFASLHAHRVGATAESAARRIKVTPTETF